MKKWERSLECAYRSIRGLREYFGLTDEEERGLLEIEERYPILIPRYYLDLIDRSDKADPVRKMAVPDLMEFSFGGKKDTSGEGENTVISGMQHKYRETALILTTNQCAMYCRHCFRKRLVGLASGEVAKKIPEMVRYVKSHKEINNILLSGGDAFLNSDATLRTYLESFCSIEHIKFIRFGTRTPVTFPERILDDDGEILALLGEYSRKKEIVVVTQFNHPNEITEKAEAACRALRDSGCLIRNQTVLLKGVNDDPKVLSNLMNGLSGIGVMPYYLFQCRPVEGVKNQFQVPLKKAARIVDEAKKSMSGPAKAFRFVMSHPRGKIEIIGNDQDRMIFKFHQAKNEQDASRIFFMDIKDDDAWLENLQPI